MGLTSKAMGRGALDANLTPKTAASEAVIALAGNPNVGKSTLFNALTGLHQHTGNWPGKTVVSTQGLWHSGKHLWRLVDIPGTYSLVADSAEEAVARDFLCSGDPADRPDAVVVVCDATCLERNLYLVLQILETGLPTVVCVNLMDEAKRKGIVLDLPLLEQRLGVPVVATVARKKATLEGLASAIEGTLATHRPLPAPVTYPSAMERAISRLHPLLHAAGAGTNSRWLALHLLDGTVPPPETEPLATAITEQQARLAEEGLPQDAVATAIKDTAHRLCRGVIRYTAAKEPADRRIDRVVTSRLWGYPLMLLLLAGILWLTVVGANTPSQWLATGLFWVQEQLTALFRALHAPEWLHGALVLGVYRTLAWVVSVMLPPMAIFFPLFTLLEDVGYLPRIAYNLDRPFARCHACGKQALTMCMGFGCNAAGVVGCRIIRSPRERLLAIITNSFVPCNGRFPTLITLITLFFVGVGSGATLPAALLLTGLILLGILATLLMTRLLAVTLLKGEPSAFVLELPPYRPPQVGRVILRSVLDRTLFVLGRAAAVAAPAGLVIWLLANIPVGDASLLTCAAGVLDPFARLMGLDGAILLAFILGFPANEIVLPLVLMTYLSGGTLTDATDLSQLYQILTANGWTWHTAACTMVFSLFHWPCSTTLLTIRKETGSWRWTALSALLPTLLGMAVCMLITAVAGVLGV
ncbi:MAG: ferrous iron transport protein B [Clostridia bacterium]|nr:ferrous iron transport protein B [Clostridia bacterium]